MARQRWTPTPRREPVTVPGAGADWSRLNDSGGHWLIRGLLARLVTSVAVPVRGPSILATAGEDRWFRSAGQSTQAAALTVDWCAFPGSSSGALAASARLWDWPTEGLLLPPGHVLASETVGLDAADQWSAIILDLIEYPEALPEFLIPMPSTFALADQE